MRGKSELLETLLNKPDLHSAPRPIVNEAVSHPCGCVERVKYLGYADESVISDSLSFGQMSWSTAIHDPNVLFYANGFSYSAIDVGIDNPRFRLAERINKRLKKRPHIHSIFVKRKPL